MYLNVTNLLCRADKIVGFEADLYKIDEHQLPVAEKIGLIFRSGLDIELFLEDIVIANPNRRNNLIIVNESDFADRCNIYYYQPKTAIFVEPPIKVEDELVISLRKDGKEVRLFWKTGSTIFRNVITRVCENASLKVLKTQ